uniref:uncharacterized protein LOC122590234 n=1 Tax=Erigeron canadensis TaxID=72917 RepID=UPI001CB9AC0E|nr:uncharacterized protein LOC122590234 [Erigeron canadensis]
MIGKVLADLTSWAAENCGKRLKKLEIAVDVVNFHLKDEPKSWGISRFGNPQLNEFVTAVNSNDNSHIEHVQPGASIREVLFKSILKDHPRHPNENNKHKDVPIRFGISDLDIIPVA